MTRAEEDLLVEDNMTLLENKDEQIRILKYALITLLEKSVEVPMPYSWAIKSVCQLALILQETEARKNDEGT